MYDNVCKFLAENYSADFSQWLLGQPVELTQISPSELQADPIRADALIFLESENTVLHIEFQTQADPNIPFRMADYRLRLYRRCPEKEVLQVVLYLKPTRSELVQQDFFDIPGTRHQFRVIRLWEQPAEDLIKFKGLLPLAILGQTRNPEQTLYQIERQIRKLNRSERNNVAAATSILAGLSLDKELIKKVLKEEIVQDSVIYQEIVAEATARGLQQGRQEGRQQGRQQGEANLVMRQLRRRIGRIDSNLEAVIQTLAIDQLEILGEELLDFTNQSDLENWLDSQ